MSVLSIFWLGVSLNFSIQSLSLIIILAFNAFSTSRWRHVPLVCSSIPAGELHPTPRVLLHPAISDWLKKEYTDEKIWCHDLQALKAFIWIEWVMSMFTLCYPSRISSYISSQ